MKYTLRYLYDESNRPVGISYLAPSTTKWVSYYFGKNLQGDITELYRSNGVNETTYTHELVARYRYDPWGNLLCVTDANGNTLSESSEHIAIYNPFRYRGYHYDGDTGFYYLKSRYYDPEIGRFINADGYASTGQGFLGHNMFAYCKNSPVAYADKSGHIAYYTVDNVLTTEDTKNSQNGAATYIVNIDYTVTIYNPDSYFTSDIVITGNAEFSFTVDNRGVIMLENDKNDCTLLDNDAISMALAKEMQIAATARVKGALSNRTEKGIARELRWHAAAFSISSIIKPIDKIVKTDIGGMDKARSDYDYNAKMFENLWKIPSVILEVIQKIGR